MCDTLMLKKIFHSLKRYVLENYEICIGENNSFVSIF